MHTIKSNKLISTIDNSEIINREVSQNQHIHEFLKLKTKTSFMHFTKHMTYNPYGEDDKKISLENKKGTKNKVEKSVKKKKLLLRSKHA